MILRSIRVEGWRCFVRPLQVGPFSEGLNVLFAPNATGKSKLFEALLRGLLDGHRVTGREVEAMRPWGRALSPTVTIEFAHGGVDYRLTKRFLDSPSSDLERRENGRFVPLAEGDAADEKAREILTQNPPGRGLARLENWGLAQVLWAPQGNLALSGLSGDLVTGIRSLLGVQVSGAEAGPIERRIDDAYLDYFTPGGKLKKGKDAPAVVRMREQLQGAEKRKREALERQQSYEQTMRRVEDLRARRAQAGRDADELGKALTEARTRSDAYKTLLSEKTQREERVKATEAQHSELKQRIEAIQAARKELEEATKDLQESEKELPLRVREVEGRERETAEAKAKLEDARKGREAVDDADSEADLARRYLDHRKTVEDLGGRLAKIAEVSGTLDSKRAERGAVLAPDRKALQAIRRWIKKRDDAQIRLEAALITLEIVPEADGSLLVIAGEETGECAITQGSPTQVKGSPEVVVDLPGVARIRARGPLGSIAEIRQERDKAANKIKELTEGFSTAKLEELESLAEAAKQLEQEISMAEKEVETLLSGESIEEIEQGLAKSTAIVDEIIRSQPTWDETPPDAEALAVTAGKIKRSFIAEVEKAEAMWETAQSALSAAKDQRAGLGERLEGAKNRGEVAKLRVSDLISDGRTDEERQSTLKKVIMRWDAAKTGLEEIERKLVGFEDDPTATVAQLEKQILAADDAATKALEDEKTEEGQLGHLSAEGPYSVLAQAEEEVARLEQELAREESRMAAVRLLRNVVDQCRAEVLTAVAGPVEATATRTLQRIAGGRLGRLQLGEAFEPTQILPEVAKTSVSIESLSGGEKEQIYLAVRLALAEVLAREERHLVVLDDVLLATDPGRLARVMTVLEEAAQRLQVLIMTCHPERYRGLEGASFIDLVAILRESWNE